MNATAARINWALDVRKNRIVHVNKKPRTRPLTEPIRNPLKIDSKRPKLAIEEYLGFKINNPGEHKDFSDSNGNRRRNGCLNFKNIRDHKPESLDPLRDEDKRIPTLHCKREHRGDSRQPDNAGLNSLEIAKCFLKEGKTKSQIQQLKHHAQERSKQSKKY